MKYDVIDSSQLDSLIDLVNEKISQGWTPLGGVNTSIDCDYIAYFQQAMILSDKAEERLEKEKP